MKVDFDVENKTLFVPEVEGVEYLIDGEVVTGSVQIDEDTTVTARPKKGFKFPEGTETSATFTVSQTETNL